MMTVELTIKDENCNPISQDFHVGNGQNRVTSWNLAEYVKFVQADGDELEAVHAQIEGIPKAKNVRVVRWFGDDAKFIVDNLRI